MWPAFGPPRNLSAGAGGVGALEVKEIAKGTNVAPTDSLTNVTGAEFRGDPEARHRQAEDEYKESLRGVCFMEILFSKT